MSYRGNPIKGVYCFKAYESKLIYVGSSKHLMQRRNLFLSRLKHKVDMEYQHFLTAIEKGEKLKFEILEECKNYLKREQYWINLYRKDKEWKLLNVFDAERKGTWVPETFKQRMSSVLKERWKYPEYRKIKLEQNKKSQFTAERLNKPLLIFNLSGEFMAKYSSALEASNVLNLPPTSVASAAKGKYVGKFKLKEYIIIYKEVLHKLDELLETHQELRAISSQAWEAAKSTMTVQRLTGENCNQ